MRYRGTTGYQTGTFDHAEFDTWCERLAALGHQVFVSEFQAPNHWEVVWSVNRKVTSTTSAYKTKTDKLYKVRKR